MTKAEIARRANRAFPSRTRAGGEIEGNHARRIRAQGIVKAYLLDGSGSDKTLADARRDGLRRVGRSRRIW